MGFGTTASGSYSIVAGESNIASGSYSTAFGNITVASGLNSTSFGKSTTASGHYSTTIGENTVAESAYETVLGRWNSDYSPTNTTGWSSFDRLFVVGNGTASNARSNAMTILKNGKVGIGTDLPYSLLHTKGLGTGEGNVLFTGTYKSANPGLAPDSNAGTRMMWYPDKSAFRTGTIDGNQWNTGNIGNYSVAMGYSTTASGSYSIATGENTFAESSYETVLGRWNSDYTPNSTTTWNSIDRLFVIGNGTASNTRSNALTILKNGKVGIGTDLPYGLLHAKGVGTGEGNVLFTGSYKSVNPGLAPDSGAGTRMMWYPDKSAFRAGTVDGSQWNTANIGVFSTSIGHNNIASGQYSISMGAENEATGVTSIALGNSLTSSGLASVAMGYHSTASGQYSTAFGYGNTASGSMSAAIGYSCISSGYASIAMGERTESSGFHSIAFGYITEASGDKSTAMGAYTLASGYYSTAVGKNTVASGDYSMSIGENVNSKSAYETVIGRWNADYTPNSTTNWNSADRIFVVGNGTASATRSNALTILKNGRVGLQTVTNPTFALELPNSATDGIGKGRANAWSTYSDGRIKSKRKSIIYGLREIMMLNPLYYYKHNSIIKDGKIQINEDGSYDIGFIAQDVYKVIPEIVSVPNNEYLDLWSMSYEKLTPILVKAIQEQQQIIDNQKKKNDSQDMLIQIQNQKIEELEKKLELLIKSIKNE